MKKNIHNIFLEPATHTTKKLYFSKSQIFNFFCWASLKLHNHLERLLQGAATHTTSVIRHIRFSPHSKPYFYKSKLHRRTKNSTDTKKNTTADFPQSSPLFIFSARKLFVSWRSTATKNCNKKIVFLWLNLLFIKTLRYINGGWFIGNKSPKLLSGFMVKILNENVEGITTWFFFLQQAPNAERGISWFIRC